MEKVENLKGISPVIKKIFEIQKIDLSSLGINLNDEKNSFDTIIIKRLSQTNTLTGTSGNQTHIAITGDCMDAFPYIENIRYFNSNDTNFKRRFVLRLPVLLMSNNIHYLKGEPWQENEIIETFTTTARSKRKDGSIQTELSYKNMDSQKFINFRELIYPDDYLIILKLSNQLKYIFLAFKNELFKNYGDGVYYFYENNKANTIVDYEKSLDYSQPVIDREYGRLVYGAPGTGKSYLLEQESKIYFPEENFERVTFYPDYSHGQFVGVYKPITYNNETKFKFIPGPFLKILVKALKNKKERYLIIIEEINRANASAVFGDMFQLLDRNDSGRSQYSISISEDVKQYLESENLNLDKIYIPENLYIWATMNTADQGVTIIDAAFKRRFDEYKLIGINDNEDIIKDIEVNINGIARVNWNNFRKSLNKYLINSFNIREDKLIGPFFIKPKYLKDDQKFQSVFVDKLIMYLAEDVLNHKKQKFFKSSSLSEIRDMYFSGKECIFKEAFWSLDDDSESNIE